MKQKVFIIVIGMIGLMTVLITTVGGYWFFLSLRAPVKSSKTFIIKKGESVSEIAQSLKEQGFIKSPFIFKTYLALNNLEDKIQAGEYNVRSETRMIDLVTQLVKGLAIPTEREIRIIEGWRAEQIGEYLEKNKIVSKEDFLKAIQTPRDGLIKEIALLSDKPSPRSLEGYLFPDTYKIFKDSNSEDIIKKMLKNLNLKLIKEMREEIKNQNKTIFEILTMASIIEAEVKSDQERALVSDLFWRRLKYNLPLEADSTINYITGKETPQASAEDIKIDSPYNTYKYRGLPPGPIANPGLSAIKAAIYPKANDYWFFLTTPKEGRAIFAKTYGEHLANKRKYLLRF